MNTNNSSSAGQKRRISVFLPLHTSSFFISEAKHLISKRDALFRLCVCSVFSLFCISFGILMTAASIFFYTSSGFPTLTEKANGILLTVFTVCILFCVLFFCYVLKNVQTELALQLDRKEEKSFFEHLLTPSSIKKYFFEYISFLISNIIICPFLILAYAVYKTSAKINVETMVICGILILTYLYLLCIIKGVYIILSHIQDEKNVFTGLKRAASLLYGNVCRFIFLNLRLLPYIIISVLSVGILHVFYTSPLISSSYASFISFVYDARKYKNNF